MYQRGEGMGDLLLEKAPKRAAVRGTARTSENTARTSGGIVKFSRPRYLGVGVYSEP